MRILDQNIYKTNKKQQKKTVHTVVINIIGAGEENRTPVASLEGWSFTIKLHPQGLLA